jgi:hypothetical protein
VSHEIILSLQERTDPFLTTFQVGDDQLKTVELILLADKPPTMVLSTVLFLPIVVSVTISPS